MNMIDFQKIILGITVFSFTCLTSMADTILLDDGSSLTGTVSKEGGNVTITTSDGKTVTVPEKRVLFIKGSKTSSSDEAEDTPSKPEGEIIPKKEYKPASIIRHKSWPEGIRIGHLNTSKYIIKRFSRATCVSPEAAIYAFMRDRKGAINPESKLERRIQKYRERYHDRKRRYLGNWHAPKMFENGRQLFQQHHNTAQDHYRQGFPSNKDQALTSKEKREMRRQRAVAYKHLDKAAMAITDLLLSQFLQGVASYIARDYGESLEHFTRCMEQAPYIRCFRQGYAMALLKKKRHEEALSEYIKVFEMGEDLRGGTVLLAEAIRRVPGKEIDTEIFEKAKETLASLKGTKVERYLDPKYLKADVNYWLLPGDTERTRDGALPRIEVDRIVVKCGVAVPISSSVLLVAPEVIKDAEEVVIFAGNGRFLGIEPKIKKYRTDTKERFEAGALISERYRFKPATAAKISGTEKNLWAFGKYMPAEMNNAVRLLKFSPQSGKAAGLWEVPPGTFLPGESGSPVLTASGMLAGLTINENNPMNDTFPSIFVPLSDLEKVLKDAQSHASKISDSTPREIIGLPSFMVFAISGESLSEK